MTTCTQCHLLNLRGASPAQNRAGWGACTAPGQPVTPMFVMYSRERVCAQFDDAPADVVAKCEVWFLKLHGEEK